MYQQANYYIRQPLFPFLIRHLPNRQQLQHPVTPRKLIHVILIICVRLCLVYATEGTCISKPCSSDIHCLCEPNYTGTFCDKKVEVARGGVTLINGKPITTASPTLDIPSSNGKQHVNGVMDTASVYSETKNANPRTENPSPNIAKDLNVAQTKKESDTFVGQIAEAALKNSENTSSGFSDKSNAGSNVVTSEIKETATFESSRSKDESQFVTRKLKEPTEIVPLPDVVPTTISPSEIDSTTSEAGSYRKGPESTKHSDNSPVQSIMIDQKLKSHELFVITQKSDVVTLSTVEVDSNLNKVETAKEVRESIIKSNGKEATPESVINSHSKNAKTSDVGSIAKSNTHAEGRVGGVNTATRNEVIDVVHNVVHVGNNDVNFTIEHIKTVNVIQNTADPLEELTVDPQVTLNEVQSQKNVVHSLDAIKINESNITSISETVTSSHQITEIDAQTLLKLLNITGSTKFADSVTAVKIEIITKGNNGKNGNTASTDSSKTASKIGGTTLIVATTKAPP
ncbi:uncharacterized protein LOC127863126 [Dreissena polymorpha]|uniref:EGF-like domain-containing protein n=1 Tax=Dreissena polymorpha TaxID=45954 RepID=A0A9D3Y3P2_DREPO|nr:uncharacterized protein LOC127863126 [Dreissena polymorpha]KAH3693158.1 hypothetical protein DPMN_192560 [Dreissena polymorpha]